MSVTGALKVSHSDEVTKPEETDAHKPLLYHNMMLH